MNLLKRVWHLLLVKQFFLYGWYLLTVWVIHVFLLSFIAFFHFLLGHKLGVIEEWVFDRGWEVVIFTKLLATYLMFRFTNLSRDLRRPLNDFVMRRLNMPSRDVIIALVFVLVFTLWEGRPVLMQKSSLELFKMVISCGGIFCFYISDFLVIAVLQELYPLNRIQRFIHAVLAALLFWVMGVSTFLYQSNMNEFVFFNFLFCLLLLYFRIGNWSETILFLLIYTCSMGAFFGMDPMWGNNFSIFEMSRVLGFPQIIVMILVSCAYLLMKQYGLANVVRYYFIKMRRLTRS